MLYSNLALFHLKLDQEKSVRYIDGAIIINKRRDHDEQESLDAEIDLAISYNNKAVIELKRGNISISREFSMKSVRLIEPRVFGMINSGLVRQCIGNQVA